MKKSKVIFALMFFFPGSVGFLSAEPKDLIVIVDTSAAMRPYYENLVSFLTGPFLQSNLELGDTFHLVSFADSPRFEIARKITGEGDVQTIAGRIFLLYPVDPPSDMASAIGYYERYIDQIPRNRQKKIFVFGAADAADLFAASSRRLGNRASVSYLKVPLPIAPEAVQTGTLGSQARGSPAGNQPSTTAVPGTLKPAQSGTPAAGNRPVVPGASRPPIQDRPAPSGTQDRDRTPSVAAASGAASQAVRTKVPTETPPEPSADMTAPVSETNGTGQTEEPPAGGKNAAAEKSRDREKTYDPPAAPEKNRNKNAVKKPGADKRNGGSTKQPDFFMKITALTPWGFIIPFMVIFLFGGVFIFLRIQNLNASPGRSVAAAISKPPDTFPRGAITRPAQADGASLDQTARIQDRLNPAKPLEVRPVQGKTLWKQPAQTAMPSPVQSRAVQTEQSFTGKIQTLNETKIQSAEITDKVSAPSVHNGTAINPEFQNVSAAKASASFRENLPVQAGDLNAGTADKMVPGYAKPESGAFRPAEKRISTLKTVQILFSGKKQMAEENPQPNRKSLMKTPSVRESIRARFLNRRNAADTSALTMLNLFVQDQNTAIGRRNIHILKTGSRCTVGGGNSDFLIFIVPLPPRIGELRFDGADYTFIPLKPDYFPDGTQAVPGCIGKTIRIVSDKEYELYFRFERFEDPLAALNRLLNSIRVPETGYASLYEC